MGIMEASILNRHLIGAALVVEAFAIFLLLTTPARAQDYNPAPPQDQQPVQGQNPPNTQSQPQNGQPNVNFNNTVNTPQNPMPALNFDWRWLLPLILLPILFLALRGRDGKEDVYEPEVAYHEIDHDDTYDEVYEEDAVDSDGKRVIKRKNVKKL